jgi:hypothetical protein
MKSLSVLNMILFLIGKSKFPSLLHLISNFSLKFKSSLSTNNSSSSNNNIGSNRAMYKGSQLFMEQRKLLWMSLVVNLLLLLSLSIIIITSVSLSIFI